MRILYLCPYAPSSTATGGGPVFGWQNIAAISELGHEIHLVATTTSEIPEDVRARVASVTHCVPIAPGWRTVDRLIARIFRSETLAFQFPDWEGISPQVEAALSRIRPDLVFADWIGSLQHLPRDFGGPTVYAHHDFIHQLLRVRARAGRLRLRRPDILSRSRLERIETSLVRRASRVISVSASDRPVFDSAGVECRYVPIVGAPIPRTERSPSPLPRAVLLGRSNTAMNATRRNLRTRIWPLLEPNLRSRIEWHQIGEIPGHPTKDWHWVAENFVVHGFKPDLSEVLRPGDLCLVPYADDTGFRAKFVTAAAHGMVNIGYERTFECAEEFTPGYDCLAARSDEHFAALLRDWVSNPELRERMSESARLTYEERFSIASVLPSYQWALGAN